jgi:PKD repeat protein
MKTKQIKFLIVAFLMATVMQGCKKAAPDPMPVADFTYSQSADGAIQFTNKSTSGRSYSWDFGNGTTSTDQNPKVVYTNNGDYVVKLSVKNSTGDNSVTKTITVTTGRDLPINADFTFSLFANGDVQFTDKSTSASTYSWDFGYGLTSTEKSPKVSLTYNGDYKVKLTVRGKFLTDIASVEKTVTVTNGKALPTVSDEYNSTKGTSGGNSYTFRNHIYTFDVNEDNKIVTANIQSADVDVAFFWYSPLGQDLNNYPQFYGPKTSRNFTDIQKLNKGKYTLVVTTKDRYAIGKDAAPVRVASARLLSTNKDFADGGGGMETNFNEYLSPRNKTYTFDVTEDNTYVDIDVASTSADTWVKLFDNLGQSQNYASIGAGRTPNVNLKVNKGNYTLLVGTVDRLAKTNFSLEINGKASNLKEKIFNSLKTDDKWSGNTSSEWPNGSFSEYNVDVIEDNLYMDVTITSVGENNIFKVYDSNSKIIEDMGFLFEDKINRRITKVSKGKYKIRVETRNKSTAAYSISIVGMVANLKKL